MAVKYVNDFKATLQGAISSGATQITLDNRSGAPASGDFPIMIDREILIATGDLTGLTWTVTRGAEGTAAAPHADASTVSHNLTAGILAAAIAEAAGAGLPAPGPDGNVLTSDGTSWVSEAPAAGGGGGGSEGTPPALADYAWFNQGGATATGGPGGIHMVAPVTGGEVARVLERALPAPPYTLRAKVLFDTIAINYMSAGLYLRDSVGGAGIIFGLKHEGNLRYQVQNYGSNGVPPVGPEHATLTAFHDRVWLRVIDDGTTRFYAYSLDDKFYRTIHQNARTTPVTPNRFGLYVDSGQPTYQARATFSVVEVS